MEFLWYEKYRPKKISSLALNPDYEKLFNKFIKKSEIPHLLFHGPNGSGKTTISRILIDKIASNSLMLNASSNDRGVNVIKTTVKQFARSQPRTKGKINIIFFDEADGLTNDAQRALNNTIEKNFKDCRFIFTCNYIDKIDTAILSRCQMFKFETFPVKNVRRMCYDILKKENVEFKRSKVNSLIERYYPDIRSVLNNLESSSVTGKFKENYLDRFDPSLFPKYLKSGKIFALRNMWINVIDFTRLYRYLFNQFVDDAFSTKERELKSEALIMIAEYMYKDSSVADREINFTACCLELMTMMNVKINFNKKE